MPVPNLFSTPSPDTPSASPSETVIEIVRPDRNLEKWPIWEPSNSRHSPQARTIQREIRLPDGSKAVATVEVGFTNKGSLTTEDQKTFYALIKYWENKQKPKEPVYFSRQQLARILKRQWGSKANQALTASLMRLRFTPFTWERSYYDSATRETVERIDTFNILSDLQLSRRAQDGHTTTEASSFTFNERILRNLLSNHTKPVFLDTILGFQSEIAQILYTHLDLVLSDKSVYERRTKELFADLGIDGKAYRYPSKRAQTLEPALKELQGAPLPTGTLREVRLERTVDDTDFKIVVRKSKLRAPREKALAAPELLPPAVTATTSPAPPATLALPFGEEQEKRGEADAGAIEQARFFYQVFFKSGDTAHPTPKELTQAADHLARLGEEKARYVITFASREAKRTGFDIQTYGGVCQYEGRALTEYETHARKRAEAITEKARKGHQERFYAAYMVYIGETFAQREQTPSAAFRAFLDQDRQERAKFTTGPMARHPTMERVCRDYDQEEARLKRFALFFGPTTAEPVLAFWQWDATLNPERLASLPK